MLTDIFTAIAANPILTGVTMLFGGAELDTQKTVNSIVCVPTTDRWKPGKIELKGYRRDQRAVGTLHVGAMFRCWGAHPSLQTATVLQHHAAAEELRRKLLVVLHREFVGVHTVTTQSWLNQDGSAMAQLGRSIDVAVEFMTPVFERSTETPAVLAPITAIAPTVRFDFSPAGPSSNDETESV